MRLTDRGVFFKKRVHETDEDREVRQVRERYAAKRARECNCQGPTSGSQPKDWKTCSHGIYPETPFGSITYCRLKPGHGGHHTWCNLVR